MSPPPVRDEDLHALVDGEIAGGRCVEVEAAAAADPAAASRLAFYRRLNRDLHRLYDPVLAEALPPLPRAPRGGLRAASLAAATLILGVIAGWSAREVWVPTAPSPASIASPASPAPIVPVVQAPAPQAPAASPTGVAQQAAVAHAAFAPEIRHPVEVEAGEEAHLVRWLSNRLGRPLSAPRLDAAGFALMGGRLLPAAGGGVAAQLMYEDRAGKRLTLYFKRPDAGVGETAFQFAEGRYGTSVFWWSDERFAYALVAALPREELLALARGVHEQLDK